MPTKLAFVVQPSAAFVGVSIPDFQVAIEDAAGNTVSTGTDTVAVAIGTNPGGASLSGTTTLATSGGVANFTALRIDRAGSGYTLTASVSRLTGATSAAFDVVGWSSASAGAGYSCGVTMGGAGYCWGINNPFGQLGNGSTTNSSTPVAVSGGLAFATMSTGDIHSCGVTTSGAAYCWGANGDGELGNGSTINSLLPAAVSGGLTFTAVSAGEELSTVGSVHSCGLTASGAAYCWGGNDNGQLGNGSSGPTAASSTPVAVLGGLTFKAVSVGGSHSCGLTTGGVAYCWGDNGDGQVGRADSNDYRAPVAVSGGLTFAAVSAGYRYTCGLTTGGAAYCWGFNGSWELGNGSDTGSNTPVPVSGGLTFTAVSTGSYHSCGVTSGGSAYCWGGNVYGELGNGSVGTGSPTPALVSGGITFAAVSARSVNTCAVTTGSAAYCWGDNSWGQLGNAAVPGSLSSTPVPVQGKP